MKTNLDIIVPSRNEAKNLPELLTRINSALTKSHISYRVVIVDDKSTDNTSDLVKSLSNKYPVVLLPKQGTPGKASAIIQGASFATSETLAMIDADLEYPPEALPEMYYLLQQKNHGVVVANRSNLHNNFLRSLGSKINRFLIGKFLLGFTCDVQSGLKVFKKEVVNHLDPKSIGAWAIDMPLLYTATQLGFSLGTVEIEFTPRTVGVSKCRQEIVKATSQIALGALRLKFQSPKIYHIAPTNSDSSVGAGVAHKGKRFITHSTLHHKESALKTFLTWQKFLILAILAILVLGTQINPLFTGVSFIAILSLLYFFDVVFSLFMVWRSLNHPPQLNFPESQLKRLSPDKLPIYTILCPLYKEHRVLPDFIKHISALDWPKAKLDVILLLEEDDLETQEAAQSLSLPKFVRTLVIPHSFPKTKPKACNYGLAHAKGEYVVIYDAEDQPEVNQLKKAYLAFKSLPASVVCLQAKLNYFNPRQNLLTRLFTAEYSLWFDVVLPGYQSLNTVIPLGGTSNHFKTQGLIDLKGWDAFNVTEDCDLGARLFKHGYKTALIDSTTLEEANSNLGNWLRQRSRWIKGYLQTWLVHNRHPLAFIRSHGWHAFFFQLVVGGKTSFTIINPFLWISTVLYFAAYHIVGPTIESLYPITIFYIAGFSAVFGNFLFLYYYMIGLGKRQEWDLVKYVFLVPFYWMAVSIAAFKAFSQLIFRPHYWEKTHHGLHLITVKTKVVSTVSRPSLFPTDNSRFVLTRLVSFLGPMLFWGLVMAVGISQTYTHAFPTFFVLWLSITGYLLTPLILRIVSGIKTRFSFLFKPHLISGSLLIASSFVANICNFLYNAYLGRSLSSSEFGLVSLMGSFFYLTSIPTSALYRTTTHRTAYLAGKLNTSPKAFWLWLVKQNFKLSIVATLLWLVCIPLLGKAFQSGNILAFVFFSPVWVLSLVGAVNAGYLNGNHKFSVLGLLTTVDSLIKLGLAWFFVTHGLQSWVYAAVPLSIIPSFVIGLLLSNRLISKVDSTPDIHILHFPKRFFATSVLASLSTLAFLSFDVILAKTFLPPVLAGQYALLSLVGKMVYFIGTLFSQFIVPVVSHAEGKNQKTQGQFIKLFLATILASLAGFIVVGVFGSFTVPFLFGSQASFIVQHLKWFTLSMVAFGAATALVNYHHIKKHYAFPVIGLGFSLVHICLIIVSHSSVSDFVGAAVITSLSYLLVVTFIHTFYDSIKTLLLNTYDLIRLFKPFSPTPNVQSESLKILIFNWYDITHKWAGGAEIYIHEIAKRWVNEGHSVTMFTGNDQTQTESQVIDGIQVVRRGGQFTVAIWAFIYYIFKFRGKFDVIVDIPKGVPFFTPLYSLTPTICLVHQVHQDMFRTELKFPFRQVALFLEAKLMPIVYHSVPFVAVSPSTSNAIKKIGLGAAGIHIVNPGVDIQKSYLPKTTSPSVIYLGRLRPYKFVDLLIKAIAIIKPQIPSISLTVAGTGEDEVRLKALTQDLHLDQVVRFLGRVTEKQKSELLTTHWVSVLPSMVEGWGITNIEANICGTPVIASNVDGLKDSVIHGSTGLLVKPQSDDAIAQALTRLLRSSNLRDRMSLSAMTWGKQFSWDTSSQQLLSVLNTVLADRPSFRFSFRLNWLQRSSV